jgi:L-threonylcarbamoyladenylate synthase
MLADDVPKVFHKLTKAFFPGPLTLIVRKKKEVPAIATGGLETVGIRCPDQHLAQQLIAAVGVPLVAPSANISGSPSSTTAEHVLADFNGKIAAVIDGGPCIYGLESTVVDLVSFDQPTLVRPGALQKEVIEERLGAPIGLYTEGPKSAPGMKYRHYSPAIPVHVFTNSKAFKEHLALRHNTFSIPCQQLTGKTLYALLRYADKSGYDSIAIDSSECNEMALINRLEKMDESNLSV